MFATRLAAVAVVVAVSGLLSGCTQGAESRAIDAAAAQLDLIQEHADRYVERSSIQHFTDDAALVFGVALLSDLTEEQLSNLSGTVAQGLLLSVDEKNGRGEVMGFVTGRGESGGGWSYEQVSVYACWTAVVDLNARTVEFDAAECPEGVGDLLTGHSPVSYASIAR